MSKANDHRSKFTHSEDTNLLALIKENGPKKWKTIAKKMPGKTARQCRDRYMNYLRDGISNKPWTEEEDLHLLQRVNEFGTHWSKISRFFVGRSANNLKNRWYTYHIKRKGKLADDFLSNTLSMQTHQNQQNQIELQSLPQHINEVPVKQVYHIPINPIMPQTTVIPVINNIIPNDPNNIVPLSPQIAPINQNSQVSTNQTPQTNSKPKTKIPPILDLLNPTLNKDAKDNVANSNMFPELHPLLPK